jgi:hypothetical protein
MTYGPDHFQHRSKDAQTGRLVRNLEDLAYTIEIKPLVVAS